MTALSCFQKGKVLWYKSMVSPFLEYCVHLWLLHLQKNTDTDIPLEEYNTAWQESHHWSPILPLPQKRSPPVAVRLNTSRLQAGSSWPSTSSKSLPPDLEVPNNTFATLALAVRVYRWCWATLDWALRLQSYTVLHGVNPTTLKWGLLLRRHAQACTARVHVATKGFQVLACQLLKKKNNNPSAVFVLRPWLSEKQ